MTKEIIEMIGQALGVTTFFSIILIWGISAMLIVAYEEIRLIIEYRFFGKIKNQILRCMCVVIVSSLPITNTIALFYCLNSEKDITVFDQLKATKTPDEMARLLRLFFHDGLLSERKDEILKVLYLPEVENIPKTKWGIYVYKEKDRKILEEKIIIYNRKGKLFASKAEAQMEMERMIKLLHLRDFDCVEERQHEFTATNLLNDKGLTVYELKIVIANELKVENGKIIDVESGLSIDVLKEKQDESYKNSLAGKTLWQRSLIRLRRFLGK